jgi:hypothetical protein
VEAAKVMADVELKKVYVHDNVTNSNQTIWTPTSRSDRAVVPFKDYPCGWVVHAVVKNNTVDLVQVQIKYETPFGSYSYIWQLTAYQELDIGLSYFGIVPVSFTITEMLYCFYSGCTPTTPISGPPISFRVEGGWVLVTHAFVYGGTDGDKIDNACPIVVSGIGKFASSPDGTMHIFVNFGIAFVQAKPKYPWEHSYWMIGRTKRTDNPASFIMTDNNYAYAYLCAPIPRWRALEDINGDGRVDWYDLFLFCKAYGLKDEDLPMEITVTAPTQAKVQTMTASAITFAAAAAVAMILSAFLKSVIRSLRH